MLENRTQKRLQTNLPVTVISVLQTMDGSIVDLSENGAQIVGASFPKGTRFQIDWQEQTLYARVMWDEVDRMGVRFEYPLTGGPLYELMHNGLNPVEAHRPFIGPALTRPQAHAGFGRRAA